MREIPSSGANYDSKLIRLLLFPSWLSGLMAVAVGIALTVGVITTAKYKGSFFQTQLTEFRHSASFSGSSFDHFLHGDYTSGTLASNIFLFAFWAVIGLVAYLFVVSIVNALHDIKVVRDEMAYTNAAPRKVMIAAFQKLAIRLGIVVVWVIFTIYFLHVWLRYSINKATDAAGHPIRLHSVEDVLLSFIVIFLAMHIFTVMLRLLFLRARVFSKALYVT